MLCYTVLCCADPQLDAFKAWLKEQEEAQDKKKPTEEPAFMSADVVLKWTAAEKAVQKLDNKKKPKPPAAKKNQTETDAADSKADKDKSESGDDKSEKADKAEAGADTSDSSSKASANAEARSESGADGDEELPVHEEL